MKKILKTFIINIASLILVSQIFAGFKISGGIEGILFTAAVLTAVNFAINPLIKLLLLPINLITLGAFRWVANVFCLYLVTLLVPYLEIASFTFPGFSYQGFTIPTMHLGSILVLILSSFLISLITTIFFWLFD